MSFELEHQVRVRARVARRVYVCLCVCVCMMEWSQWMAGSLRWMAKQSQLMARISAKHIKQISVVMILPLFYISFHFLPMEWIYMYCTWHYFMFCGSSVFSVPLTCARECYIQAYVCGVCFESLHFGSFFECTRRFVGTIPKWRSALLLAGLSVKRNVYARSTDLLEAEIDSTRTFYNN